MCRCKMCLQPWSGCCWRWRRCGAGIGRTLSALSGRFSGRERPRRKWPEPKWPGQKWIGRKCTGWKRTGWKWTRREEPRSRCSNWMLPGRSGRSRLGRPAGSRRCCIRCYRRWGTRRSKSCRSERRCRCSRWRNRAGRVHLRRTGIETWGVS